MSISASEIDAVLPQTDCRQCGFRGCLEYARAIAEDRAAINRCPVGGARGIREIARITGKPELALDPEYGHEAPFATAAVNQLECIGCGRCIRVCPSDAITGGPKRLHFVITELCTGCSLCQNACPVDCISMTEAGREWTCEDADRARLRHAARTARLEKEERAKSERYEALGRDSRAAVSALLGLLK